MKMLSLLQRSRLVAWSALGCLLLSSAACNRNKKIIDIDDRFSMNVVEVPSWFPGDEKKIRQMLTPAMEEALQREGTPDYFRFWWNKDGTFITRSDLSGKGDKVPDMIKETKRTWIYTSKNKELDFRPDGSVVEHPLTSQLRYICRYGDPNLKTPPKTVASGRVRETWTWMEYGLKVDFVDGEEVKTIRFNPTGAGTMLK